VAIRIPFPEVGRTPNFSILTRQDQGIREQKRMANEEGLTHTSRIAKDKTFIVPHFHGCFQHSIETRGD
jgi:hypothetical protein